MLLSGAQTDQAVYLFEITGSVLTMQTCDSVKKDVNYMLDTLHEHR
jgi:hypothetical protein